MKQFSVALDFELIQKPVWLDKFRKKFDEPFPYHITLKQDTYIKEADIEKVKNLSREIASKYKPVSVTFDKVFFGTTDKGHVIMIEMKPNKEIDTLQRELHNRLSTFGEVILSYAKKFEDTFKPHISIARKLNDSRLEEAKKEIGEDTVCKIQVKDLSLNISEFGGIPFNIIDPDLKIKFPLGVSQG